jgi:hypothetical protein
MSIAGPLPRWALLLMAGLAGLSLIVAQALAFLFPAWAHVPLDVAKEVGLALLVSAILAFTFERWFLADLHKDVFQAVLGYIPPAEFNDEIRSLLRYSFMCKKHVMRVAIEHMEGDCVRVTTTIERTLENITSRPATVAVHLHMDEWGFEEQTKILECYGVLEDDTRIVAPPPTILDDSTIRASTADISVPPKKTLRSYQKCSEIRRVNDEISILFGSPTTNPEIHVSAPEGIKHMVTFGPSDPKVERDTYGARYTLIGTYFPGQRMRARWWPMTAS